MTGSTGRRAITLVVLLVASARCLGAGGAGDIGLGGGPEAAIGFRERTDLTVV